MFSRHFATSAETGETLLAFLLVKGALVFLTGVLGRLLSLRTALRSAVCEAVILEEDDLRVTLSEISEDAGLGVSMGETETFGDDLGIFGALREGLRVTLEDSLNDVLRAALVRALSWWRSLWCLARAFLSGSVFPHVLHLQLSRVASCTAE